MFQQIMNFSFRRTPLQAFGWYLLFFVIGITLGGIAGAVLASGDNYEDRLYSGVHVGAVVAIGYVAIVGVLLMLQREKGIINILLALAGIGLAFLLGSLGGLVPMAVLTTRR